MIFTGGVSEKRKKEMLVRLFIRVAVCPAVRLSVGVCPGVYLKLQSRHMTNESGSNESGQEVSLLGVMYPG